MTTLLTGVIVTNLFIGSPATGMTLEQFIPKNPANETHVESVLLEAETELTTPSGESVKLTDFTKDETVEQYTEISTMLAVKSETRGTHIKHFAYEEAKKNDATGFDLVYKDAAEKYGVPWEVLSAVHLVETGRRGDTFIASYAGAQGPMQFMPATFRRYGVDGDGDGIANIGDSDDAIHSAANYLRASGASTDIRRALFAYNHSNAYVNKVLGIAYGIGYQG